MSGPFAVQPLILVVEDAPQVGRTLASTLATQGFRTLEAPSRAAALTNAMSHDPDLVLFDVSTAQVDATALATRLRERTTAPILAIVSRTRQAQGASILDAGANDFIVRPFATGELLARMRVWLRQKARASGQRTVTDAGPERLRIDRDRRTLTVEGREVHITPIECKLLLTLAHNGGRPMTEEQILAAVWGGSTQTRAQYLRAHVRHLRGKIEKDAAKPRYLLTEVGGGYRLKLG
jgi:two-component system KDP operon response regulator KdpE